MKGKAIKLITLIRLCLIIGMFTLFSCKTEESCDTSATPTWSLSVSCEIQESDTIYIFSITEVFPLCRFKEYKVSFRDEWVDIESKIKITQQEVRSNGPDFKHAIKMKDKSVLSNMMDFNYLLKESDGNCTMVSTKDILVSTEIEPVNNKKTFEAPNDQTSNNKPRGNSGSNEKSGQLISESPVVQEQKPVSYSTPPTVEKPLPAKPRNVSSPPVSTYKRHSSTDIKPSSYTKPDTYSKLDTYTKPINETNKNTTASIYLEPKIETKPPAKQVEERTTRDKKEEEKKSKVQGPDKLVTTANPPKTETKPETISSKQPINDSGHEVTIDNPKPTPKPIEHSTTKTPKVEKAEGPIPNQKEVPSVDGETFSPTKFPSINVNAACESSNYISGPFSFTLAPKLKMRLNKLTIYSDKVSSIDVSISGAYNDVISNRVVLATGKSEIGLSGFSTFLEPGKKYTIRINSSNAEKLNFRDISTCAKDEKDGPYFKISGTALNVISELKIDIE